jgi:peptide/nickel transport system substrate-binding protein
MRGLLYNPSVMNQNQTLTFILTAGMALILAACNFQGGGPGVIGATDTLEEQPPAGTPAPSATPTQVPSPTPIPRQMSICLGSEPETLFLYGGASLAQSHILEAIYDGPIDTAGYAYQPVILEKLPDLADGSAVLQPIAVQAGELVVDDSGLLVPLAAGVWVRPFGCTSYECATPWDGSSPLEMAQLTATFTLREGMLWSDGTPLTTADSVFSFEIAQDCQSELGPCGGLGLVTKQGFDTLERTASYTALDDRTLQWVGVPGFLDPNYQANFFIPLPEHLIGGISAEEMFTAEETARRPLGWGAYMIEDWRPGEFIRLRKNPNYFRASEGLPQYDLVTFRFLNPSGDATQDAALSQQALTSGACDLLDQEASQALQAEGMQPLLAQDSAGKIKAEIVPGMTWEHADFGILPASYDDGYQPAFDRPDLFGDARLRQAFALCIDRQQIVETVLNGLSVVPDTYLPPDHPLFNPDAPRYAFDPQAGAALLQQIGWVDHDANPSTPRISLGALNVPDGTPLQFTYLASPATQRQQAAQMVTESLAGCGVGIDLQFLDSEQVYAPGPEGPIFGRQFDMAQFAWQAATPPPCDLWTTRQIPGETSLTYEDGSPRFPLGWTGANATGYSNFDYDRACQDALQTLPGQDGYLESHWPAQQIFATDLPVIPLYQRLKVAVTRPDLCGFSLDPSTNSEMWQIEEFDAGASCEE